MVTQLPIEQRRRVARLRRQRFRQATGRMLPTLATLGNLVCGFAAVYHAAKGAQAVAAADPQAALIAFDPGITYFTIAGWFIFLAMVFDALDGRLARMVRSTSDLGAQLDSLADVVSFGLAPAFLVLQVLAVRVGGMWFQDQWLGTEDGARLVGRAIWVVAGTYACCGALRLARFNVESTADESAHMWFKGLPTPGAAATLASLVLLMEELVRDAAAGWTVQTIFWVLPPIMLATALLMVSNVPYPHVTNHFLRGRHPFRNLVLALLAIGLLLVFREKSIAFCSVAYMISGPAIHAYRRAAASDARTVDDLAAEVVTDDEDDDDDEEEPAEADDPDGVPRPGPVKGR